MIKRLFFILFFLLPCLLIFSSVVFSAGDKYYEHMLEAASDGDAEAQYNLGIIYRKGDGQPRNPAEAFKWFKKAAEQGHVDAQHILGMMFTKGEGV